MPLGQDPAPGSAVGQLRPREGNAMAVPTDILDIAFRRASDRTGRQRPGRGAAGRFHMPECPEPRRGPVAPGLFTREGSQTGGGYPEALYRDRRRGRVFRAHL